MKITIPKIIFPEVVIDIENLYSKYGIYILLISLLIIICSLINVRYKTKVYNTNVADKFNELIHYLSRNILKGYNVDYKYISDLIKAIYPYKNKSKINLVFLKRDNGEHEDKIIYDTLNYDEWKDKEGDKHIRIREIRRLNPFDFEEYMKYFEKRRIHIYIGNGLDDTILLYIYGNSKAAFTKRKQKMIMPFLDTIEILMSIALAQQNE